MLGQDWSEEMAYASSIPCCTPTALFTNDNDNHDNHGSSRLKGHGRPCFVKWHLMVLTMVLYHGRLRLTEHGLPLITMVVHGIKDMVDHVLLNGTWWFLTMVLYHGRLRSSEHGLPWIIMVVHGFKDMVDHDLLNGTWWFLTMVLHTMVDHGLV